MDDLLSIELKSAAYGYQLVNQWEFDKDCRLIEATLLSKENFWILIEGSHQALESLRSGLDRENALFSTETLLNGANQSIQRALYGLEQARVRDFLGVVEAQSLSIILEVAHELTQQSSCELIEIQNGRGLQGHCVLYFTGEVLGEAQARLDSLRTSKKVFHSELISPVTSSLKDYFQLENI